MAKVDPPAFVSPPRRYVPTRLARFPQRFPLHCREVEKGLFPHRFNRPEKYRHRGRVPPLEEFVDEFSSAEQVQQAAEMIQKRRPRGFQNGSQKVAKVRSPA